MSNNQLMYEGNLQEDAKVYYRAIELNPKSSWSYYKLAGILAELGKLEEALATYHQAIALNPNSAWFHYSLGQLLVRVGQLEEAMGFFHKAIEINPDISWPYYSLGQCLAEQNNWDEAIALYHRAKELNPDWADVYESLGKAFIKQGNFQQGITTYRYGMDLNPQLSLSDFLDYAKDYYLLKVSSWKPFPSDDEAFLKETANLSDREFVQALFQNYLQRSLEDSQIIDFLKTCRELTRSQMMKNVVKPSGEHQNLRQFFTSAHEEIFVWRVGTFYLVQNKLEEAIAAYHKALIVKPDIALAYSRWAKNLVKENKTDPQVALRAKFFNALLNRPYSGELYACFGKIFRMRGKLDEAIEAYQKTLLIEPNYLNLGEIYSSLAEIFQLKNLLERAREYREKAEQYLPKAPQENINLINNSPLPEPSEIIVKTHPPTPIAGICNSTKKWVSKSQFRDAIYKDVHPVRKIKIPLPKTIDQTINPHLKAWSNFKSPATFVATIPEGSYCQIDGTNTAYITPDRQILLDVSSGHLMSSAANNPAILSGINLHSVYNVEGTVAVLSGNTSTIYYHWILDTLPKLGLMEESGIDLNSVDKFLVSRYSKTQKYDFHRETLDILGIPSEKIIDASKYPHIKADRLIVSSYPGIICCPTKWAVDYLKSKFFSGDISSNLDRPERIYISRRIAGNRRIINEDEVIEILEGLGFVTVTAESMSMVEQIALFSNAKVVVTHHGGGGTNLLFCNPGTKAIEIFTPNHTNICYYIMSNHLGLEYYYAIGDTVECSYLHHLLYEIGGYEDILVNIDSLKALLKMAEVD